VDSTLEELNSNKKVQIKIFNKVDSLIDKNRIEYVTKLFRNSILISAERGINIGNLKKMILKIYEQSYISKKIELNHHQSKLIYQLYNLAEIISVVYENDKIIVTYRADKSVHEKINRMIKGK
jgi:GTP-binding protein HflX